MKISPIILGTLFLTVTICCSRNKLEPKGFSVSPETVATDEKENRGFAKDSLNMSTRPGSVLLVGINQYRLTTVFKLNINKSTKIPFIGSNRYYQYYRESEINDGNNWHYNFMPGLEAVYGYNMVNVSHFDNISHKQKFLFDRPVLIKTLYYPSFTRDTLNYKPIQRNYYMISVYDEDTNKDGFINENDLRHFFYFDIAANEKMEIVPKNYSVISSQYDSGNDLMYVYARLDENGNGQGDENELMHIFWINLNNPKSNGRQY
jgi:hypothetical protein